MYTSSALERVSLDHGVIIRVTLQFIYTPHLNLFRLIGSFMDCLVDRPLDRLIDRTIDKLIDQ